MNANILAKYRNAIESELAQLSAIDRSLRADLLEAAETKPTILQDYYDHARAEGDLNTRLGIHEHRTLRRRQLQSAIDRIAKGTFGICVTCGEDIDERRLTAQPHAACCVRCQHEQEGRSPGEVFQEPVAWISRQEFFGGFMEAA